MALLPPPRCERPCRELIVRTAREPLGAPGGRERAVLPQAHVALLGDHHVVEDGDAEQLPGRREARR